MTIEEAKEELKQYVGIPKCQDCGWKLDTDITNNCGCCTIMTKNKEALWREAYNRARELQAIVNAP